MGLRLRREQWPRIVKFFQSLHNGSLVQLWIFLRNVEQNGKPFMRIPQMRTQVVTDNALQHVGCESDRPGASCFFCRGDGGHVVAKFDTLTTEVQRAIALLQERRTALISAAVTGQIDLRGAV